MIVIVKRSGKPSETKVAIINKIDAGKKHVSVARFFQVPPSNVNTIYKQKDSILEHVKRSVVMQSTVISKRRGKIIE